MAFPYRSTAERWLAEATDLMEVQAATHQIAVQALNPELPQTGQALRRRAPHPPPPPPVSTQRVGVVPGGEDVESYFHFFVERGSGADGQPGMFGIRGRFQEDSFLVYSVKAGSSVEKRNNTLEHWARQMLPEDRIEMINGETTQAAMRMELQTAPELHMKMHRSSVLGGSIVPAATVAVSYVSSSSLSPDQTSASPSGLSTSSVRIRTESDAATPCVRLPVASALNRSAAEM